MNKKELKLLKKRFKKLKPNKKHNMGIIIPFLLLFILAYLFLFKGNLGAQTIGSDTIFYIEKADDIYKIVIEDDSTPKSEANNLIISEIKKQGKTVSKKEDFDFVILGTVIDMTELGKKGVVTVQLRAVDPSTTRIIGIVTRDFKVRKSKDNVPEMVEEIFSKI